MKCPACPTTSLVMTERSGIEIDYCPDCRGVWLDRGELDKIIERSAPSVPAPAAPVAPVRRDRDDYDDDDRRRDTSEYDGHGRQPVKRKKGLFGELFDF